MDNTIVDTPRWSVAQKLAFRFLGFYFFVYAIPFSFQLGFIWDPLVALASKITGMDYVANQFTGSGDTGYAYLQHFALLCITIIVGIIWSVLDRKRANYNKMLFWMLVVMRYTLAVILIMYGSIKLAKSQFPAPTLYRLTGTFGDASPMGLAWTFLGYSYGYNIFMGIAEALGGFLLFFRRTTMFGSLFSITVLMNVFMMNLFYDIPVKLFSFHLMCLAIFIAAPDIKRLFTFFFTNRTVSAPAPPAFVFKPKVRLWKNIIKAVFIVLLIIRVGSNDVEPYGEEEMNEPLYGLYEVQHFVMNGDTLAPLTTDSVRWNQMIIQYEMAKVTLMNDSADRYDVKVDTLKRELSLIKNEGTWRLKYKEIDSNTMLLSGVLKQDTIEVSFKKKDAKDFLLMKRGFHWVNEQPFNR